MRKVVRLALVGALLTACHTSDMATPDATDGGGSASSGLTVPWSSKPVIPGSAGGNVTVTGALFRMDNLRVIGDAGPGDPRTTANRFVLGWTMDSSPTAVTFPDAPPGLYSKITLRADGQLVDNSYEIRGTADVNGVTYPFKILDKDAVDASIQIQTTLEAGSLATLPIRVRLDDALGVIDWQQVEVDNGTLELETFDTQTANFRVKLATAFELAGS